MKEPRVLKNVSLSSLTTIGIGGPAAFFTEARSPADIINAVKWADRRKLRIFVLGGGSNVLVGDDGFDGLVIRIGCKGLTFRENGNSQVTAEVAAGESWDDFVEASVRRGLWGVECLSGIPGTAGGAPIQNIGAYGQDVSQTMISVKCLDLKSLQVRELTNRECAFEYRKSIFNSDQKGKFIVLSAAFKLSLADGRLSTYPELAGEIESRASGDLTPMLVRHAVLTVRKRKSMVIDNNDPNSRSLGSFFKNPIVPYEHFRNIKKAFGEVPSFRVGDGIKIPAAWLIEAAGFKKGHVAGRVGLSENHSLAIINRGGATFRDVVKFRDDIAEAVAEKFGIHLQMEPEIVSGSEDAL